jgi:hypothetical protein
VLGGFGFRYCAAATTSPFKRWTPWAVLVPGLAAGLLVLLQEPFTMTPHREAGGTLRVSHKMLDNKA